MKELFRKYREVLAYLFFGAATTVVNLVVFFVCQNVLGLDYKISNTINW
ncbi:GtrA family protein, partial [Enterococcus faecalis]